MTGKESPSPPPRQREQPPQEPAKSGGAPPAREVGGPKGPEPTRYGDWESNGRCSDF